MHNWYTPSHSLALIGLLFLLVVSTSSITPPFQSPDEFNHVARAYALSRGEIVLQSGPTTPSGAGIDDGLLAYMKSYEALPFAYDAKVTNPERVLSQHIRWSGTQTRMSFPNTALYFPLPYIPQALAFSLGQALDLTVHASYTMARFFSLAATLALLIAASLLYPMPPFLFAVFFLPMAVFQMGSASLDSVIFGICCLAAALLMRGTDPDRSFAAPLRLSLYACLSVLATSRQNLIPLTLLPVAVYKVRGARSCLAWSLGLLGLAVGWTCYALVSVRGVFPREPSVLEVVRQYLGNPGDFFRVMGATFSDADLLKHYWNMFVGILGWLDAPLDHAAYLAFVALLLPLAVLSFRRNLSERPWIGRLALASGAVLCAMALFVLILVCLPHPLDKIHGVQGRYFIPLAVLLCYAIFDKVPAYRYRGLYFGLLCLLTALSIWSTHTILLKRYWLHDASSNYRDYNARPDDYRVGPGPALDATKPLEIHMSRSHKAQQVGLKRIGILFRKNAGANGGAQLILSGREVQLKRDFSLAELQDGRYRFFELDGGQYASGVVASGGGAGVSMLESVHDDGSRASCLVYEYTDGTVRFTPGCPLD